MPIPPDPTTTDSEPARFRAVLRWLLAGAIGAATALGIFVMMASAIDATSIVERLFRLFPLIQMAVEGTEDCPESDLWQAVIIDGAVGTLRGGELRPLAGITAEGRGPATDAVPIDVAADGSFRYVAAFPSDAPSQCPGIERPVGGPPPKLVFRAPGCVERVVPLTPAWVPHAISLDCPRGG